eukprot:SAG31_NODE_8157_length_1507_cov_1.041903_2_plen_111_part_01
MSVFVEEDSCTDSEQSHAPERVDLIEVTPADDPALRAYPVSGVASERTIGESGSITTVEDGWVTIALKGSYVRPVLFAGVPTSNGGQHAVVRIAGYKLGCPTLYCFRLRVV